MEGYEQLCHVHGTVRLGAETRPRARARPARARRGECRTGSGSTPRATSAPGSTTARPSSCAPYARPARASRTSRAGPPCSAPRGSLRVDEPRLSTTYDEEGRQRRAGLELWVGEEDDYPRRAAGEVLCGSTLDLGALRLDCAFLRWRMGGPLGHRPLRPAAARMISAVISDFGGVLTKPLMNAFNRVQDDMDVADRGLRPRVRAQPGARRRAPAVRARARRDHRGRVPRPARARASRPCSAATCRCTASASS